jgi:hypothetical protein
MQLNEIEFLKMQISDVIQSDAFKKLDSKTSFDDIMEEYSEEKLKIALSKALALNIS